MTMHNKIDAPRELSLDEVEHVSGGIGARAGQIQLGCPPPGQYGPCQPGQDPTMRMPWEDEFWHDPSNPFAENPQEKRLEDQFGKGKDPFMLLLEQKVEKDKTKYTAKANLELGDGSLNASVGSGGDLKVGGTIKF